MTVLLLHYIHNDQEEARFITYEASLILTTPTPSKMVWNHWPYWGSFLSMNNSWTGCMSALGVLKQLGHFAPVWSWLLWTRPLLKHSAAWKSLLDIFCVHEYLGSKVVHLFRQNKSPSPKKHHTHLYTRYLCVHVWSLDWKGREREKQRECCVCKVSSHSHEIISDEEESEKDKYHMISFICDI